MCGLDEALAGFKLGALLGGNLDGLASAGVTACAGRTFDNAEGAKTNEGYFVVFGELLFNSVDIGVEGLPASTLVIPAFSAMAAINSVLFIVYFLMG